MTAWMQRLRSSVRALWGRRQLEAEMETELRFHLESRTADLIREGRTSGEAARQARVEFGGMASHKDAMRASLGLRWTDDVRTDLAYGLRVLRKSRGFTLVAAGSLALGIGANSTMFSVANEMLYERLAVPHAGELRLLFHEDDPHSVIHDSWGSWNTAENGNSISDVFPYPVYEILRAKGGGVPEIFAFKDIGNVNVTAGGDARSVQAELVSGNFYGQMRTVPALGRNLLPSDDGAPGSGPVAVISYGFWQRAFGGSPAVIGRTIHVDLSAVTIVGVNAQGFTGAASVQSSPELFMPLSFLGTIKPVMGDAVLLSSPTMAWVNLMARQSPGASDAKTQATLDGMFGAAVRGTMAFEKGDTVPHLIVQDGSRGLAAKATWLRQPIYVLLGLTACVLLLACANVANLMLARASHREREVGVRLALGASKSRIFRQVLTESLLLSALGGTLGLLLGYLGRNTLPRLLQNAWSADDLNVPFNWKVFCFTAAITVFTGIVFGVAPAWRSSASNVQQTLKKGERSATRNRKAWSGKAVVIFQLAISTLLVTCSMLFLRTLINLESVNPGFDAKNLLLFEIDPPNGRYPGRKSMLLHERLVEQIKSIPGVEGASVTESPLIAHYESNSGFHVEGTPERKGDDPNFSANLDSVGPEFFHVMRIPILAGRSFDERDTVTSPPVSIINQALARKFFPGRNPIGLRFATHTGKVNGIDTTDWTEIIGVCADTRYADLTRPAPPLHFEDYRQFRQDLKMGLPMTYLVRSTLNGDALVASLRRAVRSVDPDLPLVEIRTQQQQIDATTQQERMFAKLTSGFGLLALGLACVGVYGIMAYTVSQRTNEIGIRLALGAIRGQIRAMVLQETGLLAIAGVAAGLAITLTLVRLVKTMLYGLSATDPATLGGAASLLLAMALLAGWAPAYRASQVEPMEALRHD